MNEMIAEQPHSTPTALEMRKRTVRSQSMHASRAKIARVESDYDQVSDSIATNFTQSLQNIKRVHDDNIQTIANLQRKVNKTNSEKTVLAQENARLMEDKIAREEAHRIETKKLIDEKKILENRLADLEEAKRKLKRSYDERMASFEMAKRNETQAVEQKIAAIERNKSKKTCVYCQKDLDALVFCNNECIEWVWRHLIARFFLSLLLS